MKTLKTLKTDKYARSHFKLIVIVITFIVMNLTLISNYEYASAATTLSNDELRPELNRYWIYKRTEYSDYNSNEIDTIFEYNVSVTGEKFTWVENQKITVLVIEGKGSIVQWAPDMVIADSHELYIKEEINKNTLERIKYTQYLDLEYIDGGEVNKHFNHLNITYDYVLFDKPEEVGIGTEWNNKIERTYVEERKMNNVIQEPFTRNDSVNGSVICDRIESVTVKAGTFDTFLFYEQQWIFDVLDTTIEYYYSSEVKGFVKKVRKVLGQVKEIEELQEFGLAKAGNGNNGNDSNGDDKSDGDGLKLDLNNRNFQLLLGAICIIIACAIIGFIIYKKRK